MNYKLVFKLNGMLMLFDSALMVLPLIVALIYGESSGIAFFIPMALLLGIGLPLSRLKPKRSELYAREGFVVVSTAWIILSFTGSLPFYFSGEIPSLIDSFFETVSGFTTTGASIITNIEALSRCTLFWRSFSHWAGGMGILVFMLAIAPLSGGYTMNLMRAESPGPNVQKMTPKIGSTAKILYITYAGLTLLEIILLLCGGMPVFDSIVHAFGTAGTGGFSIKNASIAFYDSYYLQGVITVFMILFGINFNVFFLIIIRRTRLALKSEELWLYLGVIATAIILITFNTSNLYKTVYEAFHHSAFQVASIISTTGYATVNFDLWPQFSKTVLVLLMLFGSCAGSTGGGIKISRVLIMLKFAAREIKTLIHPRSVTTVSVDGRKIETNMLKNILLFLLLYAGIMLVSVMIVSLDGFGFTTNVTAVISALSNVGPGLEAVGPTRNFSEFSMLSKSVFILDMLFGRLEILPMLILFAPDTWRRK